MIRNIAQQKICMENNKQEPIIPKIINRSRTKSIGVRNQLDRKYKDQFRQIQGLRVIGKKQLQPVDEKYKNNMQRKRYTISKNYNERQFNHKNQTIKDQSMNQQVRKIMDLQIQQLYKHLINQDNSNQRVYKLNDEIVKQYLQAIYQQYKIVDPLKQKQRNKRKKQFYNNKPIQSTIRNQIYEKQLIHQNGMTQKNALTPNKVIKLKSTLIKSLRNQTQVNYNQQETYNNRQGFRTKKKQQKSTFADEQRYSSYYYNNQNLRYNKQNTQNYKNIKHIKQQLRYCLICQKAILTANIQYHEKYQCADFHLIQQMDLNDIDQLLTLKISNYQQKIKQLLIIINNNRSYQTNFTNQLSEKVKLYLFNCDKISQKNNNKVLTQQNKNQLKYNLSQLHQYYNKCYYSLLVESMEKMHWFILMLSNLREKKQINTRNKSYPLNSIHKMSTKKYDKKIVQVRPFEDIMDMHHQSYHQ